MPDSIDFYKGIFLHVILVCIIFPWFMRSLSQNTAILTPLVMSSTQKWVTKLQVGISYTSFDRKIKMKIKRYFSCGKSFIYIIVLSTFSSFDSMWWCHSPKIGWKRTKTRISCTNGDRKMEIKCGEVFLNKTVPMLLRHHLKIVSKRLKLV